jgi:hypothetical protein
MSLGIFRHGERDDRKRTIVTFGTITQTGESRQNLANDGEKQQKSSVQTLMLFSIARRSSDIVGNWPPRNFSSCFQVADAKLSAPGQIKHIQSRYFRALSLLLTV